MIIIIAIDTVVINRWSGTWLSAVFIRASESGKNGKRYLDVKLKYNI